MIGISTEEADHDQDLLLKEEKDNERGRDMRTLSTERSEDMISIARTRIEADMQMTVIDLSLFP